MGIPVFIYFSCLKTVCSPQLFKRTFCTTLSILNDKVYVQNIRAQHKMKRCIDVHNSSYTKGEYLVFDSEREFVLVNDSRETIRSRHNLKWKTYDDISSIPVDITKNSAFLGINDGRCRFAVKLISKEKNEIESRFNGKFITLRASLFTLSANESALVSQSYSLLNWHLLNNFCCFCGGILKSELVGVQKVCTSCNTTHYPNVSPVGITLVSNQDHSKVLLVRQPSFPPGMFTCIAGFIEIGESLEENVKREVAEEVGLEVHDIEYMGSQHWAIPASRLMIACFTTVQQENFEIDPSELEAAGWFTPEQVHSALNRVNFKKSRLLAEEGELWVPPRGAIAHNLIKHWLNKYHPQIAK